jgi:hypothetical protein
MRKRGGIPGNKITIRLLEVRHTGRLERAAEGIARFEQRDIMDGTLYSLTRKMRRMGFFITQRGHRYRIR